MPVLSTGKYAETLELHHAKNMVIIVRKMFFVFLTILVHIFDWL